MTTGNRLKLMAGIERMVCATGMKTVYVRVSGTMRMEALTLPIAEKKFMTHQVKPGTGLTVCRMGL